MTGKETLDAIIVLDAITPSSVRSLLGAPHWKGEIDESVAHYYYCSDGLVADIGIKSGVVYQIDLLDSGASAKRVLVKDERPVPE